MINGTTIIDAIIAKIYGAYPNVSLRDETIQQGSERPFFYVEQLDLTQWKESSTNMTDFIKCKYHTK